MAEAKSKFTEYGRDWIVDRLLHGDEYSEQVEIAIGSGTTVPDETDEQLESELYRTSFEEANANIFTVDSPGVYRVTVIVTGGIEIPDGSSVSELGVFDEDEGLIYRETRTEVVVNDGERIGIESEVDFINTE